MHIIAEKYEVVTELGVGGTGSVYLVRHTDLNVMFALKLLNRGLSDDERFIERFRREAEVLLRFSHTNTTQLRDFGRTEDGLYYLVMDYSDGVLLKEIIEHDGPFPMKQAITLCQQLLAVLTAAHEEGIVHRDIKPANIMVENSGTGKEKVRVLDFGTALLKQHIEDDPDVLAVGTPCYMSPEQAAGETGLDARSDIYSAGIVLYELLTGDVPFEGETVVQTLLMHLTQPPLPFVSRYGLPPAVEALVFRALEKRREDRYQSAQEFHEACGRVLAELRAPGQQQASGSRETTVVRAETESKSSADSQELRILCLDDNEMILHILQHILEKEGYKVFTALDCSAIHRFLFQEKIDLLVSDVQMPGMPGTKICRLLKKSMKDLKVVLFSNIPERELEKCSKENFADGWVSKHSKPEEWLAEIKKVIATDEITSAPEHS